MMIAAAALLTLTLSGCSATTDQRVIDAAVSRAVAEIDYLPAVMPDDCKRAEPHAPLVVGRDKTVLLDAERAALNRANASKIRCAQHAEKHFVVRPR